MRFLVLLAMRVMFRCGRRSYSFGLLQRHRDLLPTHIPKALVFAPNFRAHPLQTGQQTDLHYEIFLFSQWEYCNMV
ncbi:MAG: hypothetical protein KA314_22485 [Chloroflexi bacterium]|nr:hypothetical protein [Chloroflexota bacterium]MBP8058611.1 hypothetical protein [Chloroflexota bacterium]